MGSSSGSSKIGSWPLPLPGLIEERRGDRGSCGETRHGDVSTTIALLGFSGTVWKHPTCTFCILVHFFKKIIFKYLKNIFSNLDPGIGAVTHGAEITRLGAVSYGTEILTPVKSGADVVGTSTPWSVVPSLLVKFHPSFLLSEPSSICSKFVFGFSLFPTRQSSEINIFNIENFDLIQNLREQCILSPFLIFYALIRSILRVLLNLRFFFA
jgi:hypothetical protein